MLKSSHLLFYSQCKYVYVHLGILYNRYPRNVYLNYGNNECIAPGMTVSDYIRLGEGKYHLAKKKFLKAYGANLSFSMSLFLLMILKLKENTMRSPTDLEFCVRLSTSWVDLKFFFVFFIINTRCYSQHFHCDIAVTARICPSNLEKYLQCAN